MRSESVLVGVGTFVFHVVTSTVLQYWFYNARQSSANAWKIQSNHDESFADSHRWWLPLIQLKARHKPLHWMYATVNLIVAATAAFVTAELVLRDRLPLKVLDGPFWLPLLYSCVFQCVAEYHWHRLLHHPVLYARFHKIHHAYTSPEPFDDFMIHPVEGALYQFILWGPAYLFQQNLASFGVYMAFHGFCGIADHAGINVRIPYIYDSRFHDTHHRLFNANYGFPFSVIDAFYGTLRE